jgi:phage terminase small subunit
MGLPLSQRRLRHERFLAEFAKDLNCDAAMRRAGYAASYARGSGWKLLRQPLIARRIAEIRQRFLARQDSTITKTRVLDELGTLAFADVRHLYDEDGKLRSIKALDDRIAPAIASVREGKNGTWREVKLHDKLKGLELVGKHLGLFQEQTGSGLTVQITVGELTPDQLDPILRGEVVTPAGDAPSEPLNTLTPTSQDAASSR